MDPSRLVIGPRRRRLSFFRGNLAKDAGACRRTQPLVGIRFRLLVPHVKRWDSMIGSLLRNRTYFRSLLVFSACLHFPHIPNNPIGKVFH